MDDIERSSDHYEELQESLLAALTAAQGDRRAHCLTLVRAHEAALRGLRTEVSLQVDRTLARYQELTSDWPDPSATPKLALIFQRLLKDQDVIGHEDATCPGCSACDARRAFDDRFGVAMPIQGLLDDALNTAAGCERQDIQSQAENVLEGVAALVVEDAARARIYDAVRYAIGGAR